MIGIDATSLRDTRHVRAAVELARLLMATEENPIGEIVGAAGTGKTVAGRRCAEVMGAVRIACWDGMTRHQLAREIAAGFGLEGAGAVDRLLAGRRITDPQSRRAVVVDEANKLNWRHLELLRYLADECNVAVLIIGTELYERHYTANRTRELLVQMGSRIGAKRTRMAHLDRAETYAHIVKPMLGEVTDRELVTAFWTGCRKGNFRDGVELARESRRIMQINGFAQLTQAALELALKWMANRYVVEAQ